MQEKRVGKERKYIIAIGIICIILFLGFGFSKPKNRATGNIQTESAHAVVILNNIANNTNISPGDNVSYPFSVKNHEGNNVNTVELKYKININFTTELEEELPFTYKLYNITTGENVELPITNNSTQWINVGITEPTETLYKLDIVWNEGSNNSQYSNSSYSINIDIQAEQII